MDTGKGIPAEHINLVTDPFFTTKSTQNHTGLGLHQVQQITGSKQQHHKNKQSGSDFHKKWD